MTPNEMNQIIDAAGLYHTEAAWLFDNISRKTLNGWFNGVAPKNKSIFERAVRICAIIQKATTEGKFPLAPGLPWQDRRDTIKKIIYYCGTK